MERTELVAQRNMLVLSENPYPGRGIVMGMDDKGVHVVQVYWIMGRSENSRNRVFSAAGGRVFTEAAEPRKMKDSSLIIYNAMGEGIRGNNSIRTFAVSNGVQTDAISGSGIGALMGTNYTYEPDAPNFTPRISGAFDKGAVDLTLNETAFTLVILRKSLWGETCDRQFYIYDSIGNGFGYCLTTYAGDGDPLPPFTGEPNLMPITGDIEAVANAYWAALNEANRVALVVKFIPLSGGQSVVRIINKFSKV